MNDAQRFHSFLSQGNVWKSLLRLALLVKGIPCIQFKHHKKAELIPLVERHFHSKNCIIAALAGYDITTNDITEEAVLPIIQ